MLQNNFKNVNKYLCPQCFNLLYKNVSGCVSPPPIYLPLLHIYGWQTTSSHSSDHAWLSTWALVSANDFTISWVPENWVCFLKCVLKLVRPSFLVNNLKCLRHTDNQIGRQTDGQIDRQTEFVDSYACTVNLHYQQEIVLDQTHRHLYIL